MFCALLTSRYQVSVYRTNGPLVDCYPGGGASNKHCLLSSFFIFFLSIGFVIAELLPVLFFYIISL